MRPRNCCQALEEFLDYYIFSNYSASYLSDQSSGVVEHFIKGDGFLRSTPSRSPRRSYSPVPHRRSRPDGRRVGQPAETTTSMSRTTPPTNHSGDAQQSCLPESCFGTSVLEDSNVDTPSHSGEAITMQNYFAATSSRPGARMMRAKAGVRSQVSEAPRVTNGAPWSTCGKLVAMRRSGRRLAS